MSFDSINESMKQQGIVLIKGKPRGKDREQNLFATHVNNWAEVRPGATMLFLSDTFYRVVKEDKKLKGIRINWKDEDSLKDVLNFKSPGKLSVVRNNNKTPYHWKTLKHSNLKDALDAVEEDLLDSSYVFESAGPVSPYSIVLEDALESIFGDGKNVIVLDWTLPDFDIVDTVEGDDSRGTDTVDWEASFDCLYVGRPELDEALTQEDLRRFELSINFECEFKYSQWYDSGNYDTPPEGEITLEEVSNSVTSVYINGEEVEPSFDIESIVKPMDFEDLENFIKKNHARFI
jgi:hypothetical protein